MTCSWWHDLIFICFKLHFHHHSRNGQHHQSYNNNNDFGCSIYKLTLLLMVIYAVYPSLVSCFFFFCSRVMVIRMVIKQNGRCFVYIFFCYNIDIRDEDCHNKKEGRKMLLSANTKSTSWKESGFWKERNKKNKLDD